VTDERQIRVLLADDEQLITGALAALLGLTGDLTVVGQASTGTEALAMARALKPDVAVLDLQMPGLDGLAVAKAIRDELQHCRTMIITSHGRPGYLKQALEIGVRGFLPKTVSAHDLADIIRTVHAGKRYISSDLAAEAISAGNGPLTPREGDLLALAADGASIAEIAERVGLSAGTVRNHMSSALSKLGAENRHAAARMAREYGWI
jgi:two-component system response regulator DesR